MRKIKYALASILALSSIGASAAKEPSQNASSYYMVDASNEELILVPSSVIVDGDHRFNWVMRYFSRTRLIEGVKVDALWMLSDTNCADNTVDIAKIVADGPDGKIETIIDEPPSKIGEGTSPETVANLVCLGLGDTKKVLSAQDAAMALLIYRKTVE